MSTTVEEIEKTEISEDKKSELLLDSLEIRGYRCFEHLIIEELGRVNLIVGKNNVGKTALLEALWIYGTKGSEITLFEIAFNRGENQTTPKLMGIRTENDSWSLENLFMKRPRPADADDFNKRPVLIEIGSANEDTQKVKVSFVQTGMLPPYSVQMYGSHLKKFPTRFVRFGGLRQEQIQELWKNIELTKLEDAVIETVKIISNSLVSIRLVEDKDHPEIKVPFARTKSDEKPVQLRSLGEGMNRLFEIALAIANCENGMILIDEIESGIHYSIMPDIWKLIFGIAKTLNVQVFATTHSKDCIETFAQAAVDSLEDGMLIRLERQGEKIVAKTIKEDRLAEAINYEVEVR